MADLASLLQVKEQLSLRFLQPGIQANVVARTPRRSMDEAVAQARNNVHAVGVGPKVVDGRMTDEMCVRLYVIQKLPAGALNPNDVLPEEVDGVPIDVIESAPAFLLETISRGEEQAIASLEAFGAPVMAAATCTAARQSRQRPVIAGISTGHFAITAGTLSCFCHSTRAGEDPEAVHALSNNHVYANVNQGVPGDALLQQGPIDGGTPAEHFADLERFVPIALGGVQVNRVDAAIGRLLPDVPFRAEICSIGPLAGTVAATEMMRVRKHGRTTGLTHGVVTDISYNALVGMDHSNPSVVGLFQDQIRISGTPATPAFGLGGDSGSLVVTEEGNQAVGLYFAGPPSGNYGVANKIGNVLTELEIHLI
ncbi:MAG: hypothetical protein ABUT39_09615 [Acidobacteriota bacterium]